MLGVIAAVIIAVVVALTTRLNVPTAPQHTAPPPADEPRLLTISGDNLNGQTLTFPQDFRADFNLVVMPFNRDQQTAAVGWLATFEEAARSDARVDYYSIAALTDLSPPVRLLVIQGLNLAVREPATRQRVVVTFLSNQAEVVAALGEGDTAAMRVLILARDGRVLWQTSGEHTPEREAALRTALAVLLAG